MIETTRFVLQAARGFPLVTSEDLDEHPPLFIIGAGRSGTTLLRSMLVAGGEIAIPPETDMLHSVIRRYYASGHNWILTSRLVIATFEAHKHFHLWNLDLSQLYARAEVLNGESRSLARLINLIYRTYADTNFPEASCWGEQSPMNTHYLSWIGCVFPKARYVHLLRDGRDVIASFAKLSVSTEMATTRWIEGVSRARRFGQRVGPSRYLEIRYEDLVTEPARVLADVCTFAGLSYMPKMLEYWRSSTTLEHLHFEHHRNLDRPVFSDSVGRWRERLTPEQQAYVMGRVRGLLSELGYE